MRIYLHNKRKQYRNKLKEKKKLKLTEPKKEKKRVEKDMKIEIKEEKPNRMMERSELDISIIHSGESTPSRASLQQFIAKEKSANVESIEIVNIFSGFGTSKSSATAYIWDNKKVEDLSKKEEAPKEEVKEETKEAPKESKEEPKKEEPKEEVKESKEETKEAAKEEAKETKE